MAWPSTQVCHGRLSNSRRVQRRPPKPNCEKRWGFVNFSTIAIFAVQVRWVSDAGALPPNADNVKEVCCERSFQVVFTFQNQHPKGRSLPHNRRMYRFFDKPGYTRIDTISRLTDPIIRPPSRVTISPHFSEQDSQVLQQTTGCQSLQSSS